MQCVNARPILQYSWYTWYTRYTVILMVFWFTSGMSGTFTVNCLVYVAVYCQYTSILEVVYVVLCHPAWWYTGILAVCWYTVIFVVYVVYWVVVYWNTVILVVYWWYTWYTVILVLYVVYRCGIHGVLNGGICGILLGAGS